MDMRAGRNSNRPPVLEWLLLMALLSNCRPVVESKNLESGCGHQPATVLKKGSAPFPSRTAQCKSSTEAYGAAWLAPTSLAQLVAGPQRISGWPQGFSALEDASHCFWAAGSALQYRAVADFYVMHLSHWERAVLRHSAVPELETLGVIDRQSNETAADECKWLSEEKHPSLATNNSIVGVVPFYDGKSSENEHSGNSHSKSLVETRLSWLKITVCSLLHFVDSVDVYVMPVDLKRVRNAYFHGETNKNRESTLRSRVHFVTNTDKKCDTPRMLPQCGLEMTAMATGDASSHPEFLFYTEMDQAVRWSDQATLHDSMAYLRQNPWAYFIPARMASEVEKEPLKLVDAVAPECCGCPCGLNRLPSGQCRGGTKHFNKVTADTKRTGYVPFWNQDDYGIPIQPPKVEVVDVVAELTSDLAELKQLRDLAKRPHVRDAMDEKLKEVEEELQSKAADATKNAPPTTRGKRRKHRRRLGAGDGAAAGF